MSLAMVCKEQSKCVEYVCVCVCLGLHVLEHTHTKVFAWEKESKSPAILLQRSASIRHCFRFGRWSVHERWNGEKGGMVLGQTGRGN